MNIKQSKAIRALNEYVWTLAHKCRPPHVQRHHPPYGHPLQRRGHGTIDCVGKCAYAFFYEEGGRQAG